MVQLLGVKGGHPQAKKKHPLMDAAPCILLAYSNLEGGGTMLRGLKYPFLATKKNPQFLIFI